MKNILRYLPIILLTIIVGCAKPVIHDTPSGRPEITISGKVGKLVLADITGFMINRGYNLKVSSDTLLVFEKPLEGTMAGMLLGSSYDSTPNARVTYTIIETGTATRVIASFAAITNPGSAFEHITPMNHIQDTIEFQSRLNKIKAKIEGER